jgi:hypothetical protein
VTTRRNAWRASGVLFDMGLLVAIALALATERGQPSGRLSILERQADGRSRFVLRLINGERGPRIESASRA